MIRETGAEVIESLFQYSINMDLTERKISISSNIIFRNNAQHILENPEVIVQLSPASNGQFSGKILPPGLTKVYGIYTKDGKQLGWKFKEEDWMVTGKTKGVYRMEPIDPFQLAPGQWAEINDMYFDFTLDNNTNILKVDAVIIGHGQSCKVMNSIMINVN